MDDLIEAVVLQTEIMELTADATPGGEAFVMDSRAEDGVGTVVSCLMRWGTLRPDDVVVSGLHHATVRAIQSSCGQLSRTRPKSTLRFSLCWTDWCSRTIQS